MFVIRMRTVILYLFLAAVIFCTVHFYIVCEESVSVNAEDVQGEEVPILMYHGITEDPAKVSKYVISKQMLEDDFRYLCENGYHTITVADAIAYVENGTELPSKPIMITFDDGYYNNYCYAFPLLKEYQMKAVISVIGRFTDFYSEEPDENPAYSHITWNEMQEMMDSGLVEFQNHSYDLHTNNQGRNGSKMKKGESVREYAAFLKHDLELLQTKMQEHTGYIPTAFTYPFGSISEASYDVLREMGFRATLSCEEKTNYLVRNDTACLERLNRFLRSDKNDAKEILEHCR